MFERCLNGAYQSHFACFDCLMPMVHLSAPYAVYKPREQYGDCLSGEYSEGCSKCLFLAFRHVPQNFRNCGQSNTVNRLAECDFRARLVGRV